MPKTAIRVGPNDHGRRMSFEDFDLAEAQEGYLYELHRGIVVVSEVPDPEHFGQVDCIILQVAAYRLAHPGRIYRVGGGSDCKVPLPPEETERHPDVSIYKTAPPPGKNPWARWIPEIVIEIVSPSSAQRDYDEKPGEYLHFGVREYWIVDAERQEMLVLRRRGQRWVRRIVRPPEIYQTAMLPGLEFRCEAVFEAGRGVQE